MVGLGRRRTPPGQRRTGPAGEEHWWDDADQAFVEAPFLATRDLGRGWQTVPMPNNAERLDPHGDDEHSAAIRWEDVEPHERITVRFVDEQGKTISHWNKLLKGSLVRWLVTTGATDVDELVDFEHPQGYRFDPASTQRAGRLTSIVFRSGS